MIEKEKETEEILETIMTEKFHSAESSASWVLKRQQKQQQNLHDKAY